MVGFHEKVPLGRTGLMVSRLGLGASYPAPTRSYDEAFERGVNYFYWGSRRREMMGRTLRRLATTRRDELVICVQSYARLGFVLKRSVESALRSLRIDRVDVLLLGWFNSEPAPRVIEAADELRAAGLVHHIALSGHNRSLFPTLLADERYAIWQTRYNAVHRGAEHEVFPALTGLGSTERPGVVTYTTTRWGQLCDPRLTPPGERTPSGTDCYRFALTHPDVDVAIAGPSNEEEMGQALSALDRGPMDDAELGWMRRVGDHIYRRDRTAGVRDAI